MRPAAATILLLAVAASAQGDVALKLPVDGGAAGHAGSPLTKKFDPFSAVTVATPFNVLLVPGKGYGATLDADASAVGAVGYSLEGGVLTVATDATFKTDHPIKLTIQMPATALAALTVASRKAVVALAPGFKLERLTVSVAGASRVVLAPGFKTSSLDLDAAGTSVAVLGGDLGDVSITAADASMVTGSFKGRKISFAGQGSAVLDVATDAAPASIEEADGGSAHVTPGARKDPTIWSVDWTCGLEVATATGVELSARATVDSKFTRAASCDAVEAAGKGGVTVCYSTAPCAFTDDGHVAMLRTK